MTLSQDILSVGRAWRHGQTDLGPRFGDLHLKAVALEAEVADLTLRLPEEALERTYEPPVIEPWKVNAREQGCYCASYRKPCPYHEGFQAGYDERERTHG